MIPLNVNLVILTQRIIELLMFYLVLANIHGKDLKESFTRLIKIPQGVFYGNIVLLLVYPVTATLMIQTIPGGYGILVDHFLRPLLAYFLLRRTFDLKKLLLSNVLVVVSTLVVAWIDIIIPLRFILSFLAILILIIGMAYQGVFRKTYLFLVKKEWLFTIVSIASLIVYLMPLLVGFSLSLHLSLFALAMISGIYLYNKTRLETATTTSLLRQATPDEFLETLESLSSEYQQVEMVYQFVIEFNNIIEIKKSIEQALEKHAELGTIKNYKCIATKEQIKINVIL
ncbi:MAG: hypothetical protein FWE07_02760 [Turicibacter sp.]|nr:hypothetical protein [Turicibacter sp.]